jgi:integrase/recombinase XerD
LAAESKGLKTWLISHLRPDVQKMKQKDGVSSLEKPFQRRKNVNVKSHQKYERFGETIRYLTLEEWQKLLDCIDNYKHKLMLQMIYELGCRVGEFVRIQLKHLNFSRSTVFFPAENTKTRRKRTSFLPRGLMNEIVSMLKAEGRVGTRDGQIKKPDDYLFKPSGNKSGHYSENRLRQIFQQYVRKAGLNREYGTDSKGRKLHQLTIHSLRHSHLMHYIHIYKLPLPIVQKQVGHRTLQATSAYLRPSDETVASAYESAMTEKQLAKSHSFRGQNAGPAV